jgi:hypothetical protein
MSSSQRFKIEIYVPEKYVDAIRTAMNEAGACRVGNYDNCMSVIQVAGYWRPLEGSEPFHGNVGEVNTGTEVKIETVCDAEHLDAALNAARKEHPYEEPLIHVIPLYTPQQ